MKFVFIGGTYRGFRVLRALHQKGFVPEKCFVLKEDDHEQKKASPEILDFCRENGIEATLQKSLKDEDYAYLESGDFTMAVVCSWRTLIRDSVLPSFSLGMIVSHDSLLPRYRGFAPLNWAMINGEKETGVTLFPIMPGPVDSGPIISQEVVPIDDDDYAWDVYEKVISATEKLYLELFERYGKEEIVLTPQDANQATYTCKRCPDDGAIDWSKSAESIRNTIRALAPPYPGAFCLYDGQKFIISKAVFGQRNTDTFSGRIPGRVIGLSDEGIEVLCGEGSLLVQEWIEVGTDSPENPRSRVTSILTTLQ